MAAYVYDLAQLIHQQELAPVTIVAHSLGGNICLRYAGVYPDKVRKLVAIEGLGPSPKVIAERKKPMAERMRDWIDEQRKLSGPPAAALRLPSRMPSSACRRRTSTSRPSRRATSPSTGVNQNEDGTYSWKFDNYVRAWAPYDMTYEDIEQLWTRIACPTLLVYGKESWASNPETDGRIKHFKTAKVVSFENAGHWVHHDRLEGFIDTTKTFIA